MCACAPGAGCANSTHVGPWPAVHINVIHGGHAAFVLIEQVEVPGPGQVLHSWPV